MKTLYILAGFASLALSSSAFAGGAQDRAVDSRGQAVVSSSGDCVRTKWDVAIDPCGKKAEAPAKPAPKPVVQKHVTPEQKIAKEQRTVLFGFNKSDLTAEATAKLDSLVEIVKSSSYIKSATVVGYADRIGSNSKNIALSEKRAAAVQEYLSSRTSIPTKTLVVSGKGATNSVTNCSDKMKRSEKIACLAADRRVEVEFEYAK